MTGKKMAGILGAGILAIGLIAGATYFDKAQDKSSGEINPPGVTGVQEIETNTQTDQAEPVEPTTGEDSLHPVKPDNVETTDEPMKTDDAGPETVTEDDILHPVTSDNAETTDNATNTDEAVLTDDVNATEDESLHPVNPDNGENKGVSATPTMTLTPKPTGTPVPTSIPKATSTPKPSNTPVPTKKLERANTPTPTNTVTPTPTNTSTPTPPPTEGPVTTEYVDPLYGKNWGRQERLVRRTDIEEILLKKINDYRIENGLPAAEDPWDFDTPNTNTGKQYAEYLEERCVAIASRNAKECRADHEQNMIGVARRPFMGNDSAEYIAEYLLNLWKGSPNHNANLLTDLSEFEGEILTFEVVVYDYCVFEGYDDAPGTSQYTHHCVAAIVGFGNATEEMRIK